MLPLPVAGAALAVAVASQMAASLAFMFNVQPRLAALVLVAFLVPVTFIVHDFWNMDLEGNRWDTLVEQRIITAWNKRRNKQAVEAGATEGKAAETELAAGTTPIIPRAALASRSRSRSAARGRGGNGTTAPPSPGTVAGQGPEGILPSGECAHAKDTLSSWSAPDSCAVPNFVDTFSSEFVHFFQNIGMLGGLLLYIAFSSGAQ
jgi:uncharacterized membrane protein YphA (DoxX/SURF4 family)